MKKVPIILSLLSATSALSTELTLSLEIPQIDTAKQYRPYVAAWIENQDNTLQDHLLVWYEGGDKKDETDGEEWLKDLRRWWRKGGRKADMPIDGVSGATRKIGTHEISFSASDAAMQNLTDGKYTLYVEAVREEGGREVVKMPFSLPLTEEKTLESEGQIELGRVTATLKP